MDLQTASTHPPSPQQKKPKKKFYQVLYFWVLAAIVLGVIVGYFAPETGEALKPLGDAFIKLVKLIIAPVIFLTVVTGIASMTNMGTVGRIAAKALGYFIFFSTLALIVGLVVGEIIQPGAGLNVDPSTLDSSKVEMYAQKAHESSITGFLIHIIPDTLVSPLINGNILQVLFVAVLFGVGLAKSGEAGKPILNFMNALIQPVFKVVNMLMHVAPIGTFGAMAFTIGAYGISSIVNMAMLIGTFYITAILFVCIVLGAVAWFNGFSIFKLVRYIKDELLLVLGTSSSEAALPSLMQKMEDAGCKKTVVGLVIPTGYSFNLDGTNIYMTLASLFIAQACNIHLTLEHEIMLLLVAMISSKGAAGVTGAGFITLAATLSVVPELPVEGMALVLGVDRFMSECRALTNLVGNACATVVVSRWENALDKDALRRALG